MEIFFLANMQVQTSNCKRVYSYMLICDLNCIGIVCTMLNLLHIAACTVHLTSFFQQTCDRTVEKLAAWLVEVVFFQAKQKSREIRGIGTYIHLFRSKSTLTVVDVYFILVK